MCMPVVDVATLPHLVLHLTVNVKNFPRMSTKWHDGREQMNAVIYFDSFQVVSHVLCCVSCGMLTSVSVLVRPRRYPLE